MTAEIFSRAQRQRAKARVLIDGPSGSGKTKGALLIAKGLGGKTAMLDTEHGSGSLYADVMEYDTVEMGPPFSPENYIKIIRAAEEGGYNNLIIDSITHEWTGSGGILETVDSASGGPGGKFKAWAAATPRHNAFIDAILRSPINIIATVRSKQDFALVEKDGGGKEVKKLGMAPITRDGMEYEFTCVLDVAIDRHMATSSKDRTGLYDGLHFIITEDTGKKLKTWLESGVEPIDRHAAQRERIRKAVSVAELKGIWDGLTRDEQAALEGEKNTRRDRIAKLETGASA